MISSWGKILESIFTNKQSEGKCRGGKTLKGGGGISGRRGLRKQTHKILPSWSRHQTKTNYQGFGRIRGQRFLPHPVPFPTLGISNESKGCCEEDAKIVCPSGTKGSRHHAREDAFSLPCSFREPACVLAWSTSWKILQKKDLISYTLVTHSPSYLPAKNNAVFFPKYIYTIVDAKKIKLYLPIISKCCGKLQEL